MPFASVNCGHPDHSRMLMISVLSRRESLAFATEPVFASLANVLKRHDNLPVPVPSYIKEFELFDVEIKYGLFQVRGSFYLLC